MIDFAFCGLKGMGGVKMRAESVAEMIGAPFFDCRKPIPKCRTLYLCKYDGDRPQAIRKACDRLIWDGLDVFSSWKAAGDSPATFWLWCEQRLRFDEIVATTSSCASTMNGLGIPVHLLPHHSDPRCNPDWYDPNGHVAYAGGLQYINPVVDLVHAACRKIGREFRLDTSRQPLGVLQDAALHLHLRYPPYDSAINRACRPQVKAENCAACGAKMLASNHPCVTSLRPEVPVLGVEESLEDAMIRALGSEPLRETVTLESHCTRLMPILSGSAPTPVP